MPVDAVLDKALALRGVTGVLVLTRDSWLTIASRGALTASDAPTIESLLFWTKDESTGSIPWQGAQSGRCLHFHRAKTHTLILLRHHQHTLENPNPKMHTALSGYPGSPPPRAPRMRFALSATSSNSSDAFGLQTGSASLFAPSCSMESSQNVHRPSSWY